MQVSDVSYLILLWKLTVSLTAVLINCQEKTTFTAVALKKLNKEDLTVLAISPQNNMDSSSDKVLEELNTLNQKLRILESDATKNTNTLLSKQIVELKRQCWVNTQYSKRNFFVKIGLLKSLSNEEVKTTVCGLLQKLGCKDLNIRHWIKYEESNRKVL